MIYDLHTHTTASDGDLTPTELITAAQQAGVDVIAITDHDTTAGLEVAANVSHQLGLALIPGVEISSRWGKEEVHVVGLNIDPNAAILQALLANQQQKRVDRAIKIGEKLTKLGYPNLYSMATKLADTEAPGRPFFAKALVDQGICKSINAAFTQFLGTGKKAFIQTEWATLEETSSAIRASGGISTLAHPGKYKMTHAKLTRLTAAFKESGGEAIEVSTNSHTPDQLSHAAMLANQFGLLASTGSDFHTPAAGWCRLGKFPKLPENCTPVWHRFNK